MKLQITRVLKDELARTGEDLPKWLDPFLYVINQFIDQVGKCLKGQVTFADNIFSNRITVKLTHNTEYIVNPGLAGKTTSQILGVWPILANKSSGTASSADVNVITGFGVNLKQNGQIGIVAQFSQGTGISADVTFLVLFA